MKRMLKALFRLSKTMASQAKCLLPEILLCTKGKQQITGKKKNIKQGRKTSYQKYTHQPAQSHRSTHKP